MKLVFRTPSNRCPARVANGGTVVACKVIGESWVRRIGKRSQEYLCIVEGPVFATVTAFEDELFLTPSCPECGSVNLKPDDVEPLFDCYNCGSWFNRTLA